MMPQRAPLILVGQIYLSDELDEYLIVTKNNRGQVFYKGNGFSGQSEDSTFISSFQPVDPADVDDDEIELLLSFCPDGTEAKVGFIIDETEIEMEEEYQ